MYTYRNLIRMCKVLSLKNSASFGHTFLKISLVKEFSCRVDEWKCFKCMSNKHWNWYFDTVYLNAWFPGNAEEKIIRNAWFPWQLLWEGVSSAFDSILDPVWARELSCGLDVLRVMFLSQLESLYWFHSLTWYSCLLFVFHGTAH